MNDKCTQNRQAPQPIAGILAKDANIEFFGIRKTREVKFFQNGKIHDFCELQGKLAAAIANAFDDDIPAQDILNNLKDKEGTRLKLAYKRKLELYVYYCWGSMNNLPDAMGDALQMTENFRETTDCKSLGFKRKKICIDGKPLKPREIVMIDLFAKDYKDEVIAKELGIAMPTFNQHKRTLFDKAGGVMTKTALMIKAVRQQIPRL